MSNAPKEVVPVRSFKVDRLGVNVYANRQDLGMGAGLAAGKAIRDALGRKDEVRVIFAAAPSQNECLETLVSCPGIEWNRVVALHMDEYIGLAPNAPERFSKYLKDHIFDLVPFKRICFLDPPDQQFSTSEIVARYKRILAEEPIDVVCMGIGENGHIAFNDPPAAFNDPEPLKIVDLDEICRQQQVNDGCFPSFDAVPKQAVSLTIPTLLSADVLVCSVPSHFKRNAVHATLAGPVTENCPATALRNHHNATLFVELESCDVEA